MTPPVFVVVEGLDGTGKSTVASLLARTLGARHLSTPARELRGARAAFDERYAGNGLASQLFYAAAVVDASRRARSSLAHGRSIVVDRYWASTCAYDVTRPGAVDLSLIEQALQPADVTLFLTVDREERRRRLAARGTTDADRVSLVNGRRIADAYRRALKSPVCGRVVRVDTTHLTPGAVCETALEAVGLVVHR
ncbi:MAG: hypothetical protein RL199_595 [Pseudomonadota bacterium]|jgi:thymidylate kinase